MAQFKDQGLLSCENQAFIKFGMSKTLFHDFNMIASMFAIPQIKPINWEKEIKRIKRFNYDSYLQKYEWRSIENSSGFITPNANYYKVKRCIYENKRSV